MSLLMRFLALGGMWLALKARRRRYSRPLRLKPNPLRVRSLLARLGR
jgi:hypothetical protein